MAPHPLHCPSCQQPIDAEAAAGQELTCPHCQHRFQAPEAPADSAEAASSAKTALRPLGGGRPNLQTLATKPKAPAADTVPPLGSQADAGSGQSGSADEPTAAGVQPLRDPEAPAKPPLQAEPSAGHAAPPSRGPVQGGSGNLRLARDKARAAPPPRTAASDTLPPVQQQGRAPAASAPRQASAFAGGGGRKGLVAALVLLLVALVLLGHSVYFLVTGWWGDVMHNLGYLSATTGALAYHPASWLLQALFAVYHLLAPLLLLIAGAVLFFTGRPVLRRLRSA